MHERIEIDPGRVSGGREAEAAAEFVDAGVLYLAVATGGTGHRDLVAEEGELTSEIENVARHTAQVRQVVRAREENSQRGLAYYLGQREEVGALAPLWMLVKLETSAWRRLRELWQEISLLRPRAKLLPITDG